MRIGPLSVATSRKMRVISDLSRLNKSLEKFAVKFEDVSKVLSMLPKEGFMASFDLKSGFHYINIQLYSNQRYRSSRYLIDSTTLLAIG